jgi:hypothetical protein
MTAVRRYVTALVVGVMLSGCSAGWRGFPGTSAPSPVASQALAEADRAALGGRPREALTRYEAIVRDHPEDPAAAEALHRLVMLRLEPGSPLRDKRIAASLLRRLANEHEHTLAGREARTWRALLRDLDRCEVESTRNEADAEKLRQTLESIKDSDLEQEQHQ